MEVKATSSSGPIFSSNWRHCGLISNTKVTHSSSMVRILDESKNTNIFTKIYFAYQLSSNPRINRSLLCAICNFLTFKDGFEYNQRSVSKSPCIAILLLKICIWLRLYYRDTLAYSSLHKPTISSNKISISQPLCQTFNV